MADGQVGRPPRGSIAQARSETAKRAYVAARLEQEASQNFLDGLGVAIHPKSLSRAGTRLLWHRPDYNPRGRAPSGTTAAQRAPAAPSEQPLRDWLAIDTDALNVKAAVVMLHFDSRGTRTRAYRDLQHFGGVVQLMSLGGGEPEGGHRLLAVVLSDGVDDEERVREHLRGLDARAAWHDIDAHTVEPAVRTWRHLAQVAAEREGLRT